MELEVDSLNVINALKETPSSLHWTVEVESHVFNAPADTKKSEEEAGMELEQGLEEAFANSVRIGDDIVAMQPLKPLATEEEFCMSLFAEGISLVLSQWTTLQEIAALVCGMSAPNIRKYVKTCLWRVESKEVDQFAADIFTWFTKSNEPRNNVDKLAKLLCDAIMHFFRTKMRKYRSINETANRLMNLHKEFLQGKCESNIEKLRETIEELRQSPYNGAKLVHPSIWRNDLIKQKKTAKKGTNLGKIKPKSMKVRKGETKRISLQESGEKGESDK